ncbi:putative transcription factor MBF1 family [Medicago truncatula]|uniref:Putative transcription factor MBF1 family n=1 Tax=Medicago truncatula TaxID=3880 RepID=A0A396ICW5_MEDTR|nr:putative transcription factor MBF1 family [Medicago truncatula]
MRLGSLYIVNAARRAGADIETVKKHNAATDKAASSSTSLNTKRLDEAWFSFVTNMFVLIYVIGPLMNNPICEIEKAINKLRMKYKTYIFEYVVEDVGSPSSCCHRFILGFYCYCYWQLDI